MSTESELYPTNPNYNWNKHELKLRKMFMETHSEGLFMDIGAYHGLWSFSLRNNFHQVVAFEMVGESYATIAHKINEDSISNVNVFQYAVGEHNDGFHKYFVHKKFEPEASIQPTRHDLLVACDEENKEWRMAKATTVDNWKRTHLPEIPLQLIKIDVENFEVPVIRGAMISIQEFDPHLVIEIHKPEYQEEILKLLPKTSFLPIVDSGMPHLVHFGEQY